MHKTCLFLYTPDKCYDVIKDAEIQLMEYSVEYCDSNNWSEIIGIVRPDGRCHVQNEWQVKFTAEFTGLHVSLADLRLCALRGFLEEFGIEYTPDADYQCLHELFITEAPSILSQFYASTATPADRRRELVNLFEHYNRCQIYPFTPYWTTPYEYIAFDLRPDRFEESGSENIRDKDAVMLVDIHC